MMTPENIVFPPRFSCMFHGACDNTDNITDAIIGDVWNDLSRKSFMLFDGHKFQPPPETACGFIEPSSSAVIKPCPKCHSSDVSIVGSDYLQLFCRDCLHEGDYTSEGSPLARYNFAINAWNNES